MTLKLFTSCGNDSLFRSFSSVLGFDRCELNINAVTQIFPKTRQTKRIAKLQLIVNQNEGKATREKSGRSERFEIT